VWPQSLSFIPARTEDLGVIIGEDRCTVQLANRTLSADARIVFRPHLFPSTEIELASLDFDFVDEQPVTLILELSGFVLRDGGLGGVPANRLSRNRKYRHRVRQAEPMLFQKDGLATSVECIIYNLSRFGFGGGPSNGLEELSLAIPSGWRATIGPLSPTVTNNRDVLELLGTPWRRPTNTLRLSRVSGGSAQEIDETLFLLRFFLSFAWGRNIGIGLAQGFSEGGELVYVMPGITRVDAQIHPVALQPHWFPPGHAEILGEILPGFWNRMTDPEWKDYVEWAIYWWLSANHAGQVSETSILASQAGLESVGPGLLEHYGGLSKQQAKNVKPTAEKIRRMLTLLRVPHSIPGQLDELRTIAAARNWDGTSALTQVRNALVHPAKGDEAGLAFEASQLGMWYLELVLLFLFGYRGQIFNRTVFRGYWYERDLVPWAQP
jgi:hypothetical protein